MVGSTESLNRHALMIDEPNKVLQVTFDRPFLAHLSHLGRVARAIWVTAIGGRADKTA